MNLGTSLMAQWASPSILATDPTTGSVPGTGIVTVARVKAIPAVARALGVIGGLISQMPLNPVVDGKIVPRPRLLAQPDPCESLPWWLGMMVDDYLVHGNAVHYVAAWGESGLPESVVWLPAQRMGVWHDEQGRTQWTFDGALLDPERVVHVKRGADPLNPLRGIGVVEQHMPAFARVADQEQYEAGVLRGSAVPSAAVIMPNSKLTQEEASAAKERWMETFGGPVREPAILPKGAEVKTLAWNPQEQQLVESRKLSVQDVASIFNIDAYWLGVASTGYSYKSPAPMYLNLMRQTIGPISGLFESTWGPAWLPEGQALRFDTQSVLGDDMPTTIQWVTQAIRFGLLTPNEGREYIGKSPVAGHDELRTAVDDREYATVSEE